MIEMAVIDAQMDHCNHFGGLLVMFSNNGQLMGNGHFGGKFFSFGSHYGHFG